MIAKGIIEELIDTSRAKVRIPFVNGYKGLSNSVPSELLDEAQISTAFGIYPNLNVGDEVYVAFENGYVNKPIIIGAAIETKASVQPEKGSGDAIFDNLTVTGNVTLPANTMLGATSLDTVLNLIGDNGSIAESLNTISTKILDIYDIISKIPDIEVIGYKGFYDGTPHEPSIVVKSEATTLLYSTDGERYSAATPSYRIGTNRVYVKASTLYSSIVKEVLLEILPLPINFYLKEAVFKYTGKAVKPEIVFNTVNDTDIITADSVTYLDENDQELSQIADPGTYRVKVNSIGGADADCYLLMSDFTATLIITDTDDYVYEWGGVTNTVKAYDGNPHTFTIYESLRGNS